MDWQGIEWVVPVYEVLMIAVPVYGFIVLRRRVKRRALAKMRAFLYYTGLVISPVAIYALFFLGLVGLEEVAERAIVTEGLARSVLISIGMGLVAWLVSLIIFGITLIFSNSSTSSPDRENPADAKNRPG